MIELPDTAEVPPETWREMQVKCLWTLAAPAGMLIRDGRAELSERT